LSFAIQAVQEMKIDNLLFLRFMVWLQLLAYCTGSHLFSLHTCRPSA